MPVATLLFQAQKMMISVQLVEMLSFLFQTDLILEAENLGKFGKNFEKNPNVQFPTVLFSSQDLIVQSFEVSWQWLSQGGT